MKKTILFAVATALCTTLSAQYVNPLDVTLVEFNLDTVRHYAGTDEKYLVELEALVKQVKADNNAISEAQKTAKRERNYYKDEVKRNKQEQKQLSKRESLCKAQEKADKKEQKDIDKQRKALLKDMTIDQQILADNNASLAQRETNLRDRERRRNEELRKIKSERDNLKDKMIDMENYNHLLKDKEAKLKTMLQLNKQHDKQLKNETKAIKTKIKDAAKVAKLQAK